MLHSSINLFVRKEVKMTIFELAQEYEQQYAILNSKMDALKPLLCVYRGEDLLVLRRRIKIYYDMASECKRTASLLSGYYKEDEHNDRLC